MSDLDKNPITLFMYYHSLKMLNHNNELQVKLLSEYEVWINEQDWKHEEKLYSFYNDNVYSLMTNYNNEELLEVLYKVSIELAQENRLVVFKEVIKTSFIDYLIINRKYKKAYNLI